jgi:hypothetical protein
MGIGGWMMQSLEHGPHPNKYLQHCDSVVFTKKASVNSKSAVLTPNALKLSK